MSGFLGYLSGLPPLAQGGAGVGEVHVVEDPLANAVRNVFCKIVRDVTLVYMSFLGTCNACLKNSGQGHCSNR
jgi:hypothetical protein